MRMANFSLDIMFAFCICSHMTSSQTSLERTPRRWMPPTNFQASQSWRGGDLTGFRRSPNSLGGGGLSMERRVLHRAEAALTAEPPTSAVYGVGRPWLDRPEGGCAFIVAGESWGALSCCAPGKARRRGWGSYCADHAAEVFKASPPRAEARR